MSLRQERVYESWGASNRSAAPSRELLFLQIFDPSKDLAYVVLSGSHAVPSLIFWYFAIWNLWRRLRKRRSENYTCGVLMEPIAIVDSTWNLCGWHASSMRPILKDGSEIVLDLDNADKPIGEFEKRLWSVTAQRDVPWQMACALRHHITSHGWRVRHQIPDAKRCTPP